MKFVQMWRVVFSESAVRGLRRLPQAAQAAVKKGARTHLEENDPRQESRNKFRLRRASPHAEYELRIGSWRVFYRVIGERVEVLLIGEKKGNALWIDGKEFEL